MTRTYGSEKCEEHTPLWIQKNNNKGRFILIFVCVWRNVKFFCKWSDLATWERKEGRCFSSIIFNFFLILPIQKNSIKKMALDLEKSGSRGSWFWGFSFYIAVKPTKLEGTPVKMWPARAEGELELKRKDCRDNYVGVQISESKGWNWTAVLRGQKGAETLNPLLRWALGEHTACVFPFLLVWNLKQWLTLVFPL